MLGAGSPCAERNGFEYGWTYNSRILWQEEILALLPLLVADKTETIKLGHCVTNPGIRDPTITASWVRDDAGPCPEAGW